MLSIHHLYTPQAALRPYVLAIAASADPDFLAPTHTYYSLPTTFTMLVWHGRGVWMPGGRDFGALSRSELVVMRPGPMLNRCPTAQGSLVTIFRPGGALRLLGVEAHALPHEEVPLDALLGVEARALAAQLGELGSNHARVAGLERWMLARLSKSKRGLSMCGRCLASAPREALTSVRALAQHAGLSQRQLHKQFVADLGLSPQAYLGLHRLRIAIGAMQRESWSWAQVAAHAGYYDQPHMSRDFQRYVQHAPAAFRELMARSSPMLDGLALPNGADSSNPSPAR